MPRAIKFSTGPVENAIDVFETPGISRSVFAKALNNNSSSNTTVTVRLFKLNGKKVLVTSRNITLAPGASGFEILDVANLQQFEIQFIVRTRNVLVSAWGKDANGEPIAVHRFTQSEMAKTYIC